MLLTAQQHQQQIAHTMIDGLAPTVTASVDVSNTVPTPQRVTHHRATSPQYEAESSPQRKLTMTLLAGETVRARPRIDQQSTSKSSPETSTAGEPLPHRPVSLSTSLPDATSLPEHIDRLISHNERLLEPSPILVRRRQYHRQQSTHVLGQASLAVADASDKPAIRRHRPLSGRTQSLLDQSLLLKMVLRTTYDAINHLPGINKRYNGRSETRAASDTTETSNCYEYHDDDERASVRRTHCACKCKL
jgi:hypothetical protein